MVSGVWILALGWGLASCWISVLTTVCSGKRVNDQFCDCIIRPPGVCLEHSRKKGRRARRVG